jgi:hypothetical protein
MTADEMIQKESDKLSELLCDRVITQCSITESIYGYDIHFTTHDNKQILVETYADMGHPEIDITDIVD